MHMKIVALALAAGASTALADSVEMTFTGLNGRTVNVVGGPRVNAGFMRFNVDDGSNSGGKFTTGSTIRTFCIDVDTTLDNPDVYDITTLTDVKPVGSVTTQEADAIGRMLTYAVSNGLDFTSTTGTGRDNAATFQIALWEVLSDFGTDGSGLDASTGSFAVSGSDFTGDATLLTALFGAATNTLMTINPNIIIHGLDTVAGQDQMYFVVIPLPSGAGLAAAGLLGLAAVRRRSR